MSAEKLGVTGADGVSVIHEAGDVVSGASMATSTTSVTKSPPTTSRPFPLELTQPHAAVGDNNP